MKNSTSLFTAATIFILAFLGLVIFPGETQSQMTASLFVAVVMGLIGLVLITVAVYVRKKEKDTPMYDTSELTTEW